MQRKVLIGFLMTLFIVLFIPVYWALEPTRQEAARIRQRAEAAERGAHIYAANCILCHGAQGEGVIGPALKGTRLDEAVLTRVITRGRPGTAMPPMGREEGGSLSEHQIQELVTFIQNWDQSLLPVSETPPPATQPPTTSPPIIDAARILADRCSGCHGRNREGIAGFAPPLTPTSLAKLSHAEVIETITAGRPAKGMPPFGNTLSPEQIDALMQLVHHTPP